MSTREHLNKAGAWLVENILEFCGMLLDTRPRQFCIASFFQGVSLAAGVGLLMSSPWDSFGVWLALLITLVNMKTVHGIQEVVTTHKEAELGERVERMRSINWLVLKGKWATPEETEQLHKLVAAEWVLAIKDETMYSPEWTPVQTFVHKYVQKIRSKFIK